MENIKTESLINMMCQMTKKTWDGTIKLDVGCGTNKRSGYIGVDKCRTSNADIIFDLTSGPLPLETECIDVIHNSHFIEHLTPVEYVKVMGEFWRVLKVGGVVDIEVPYWKTRVSVQDPTHRMQFCETSFKFLDQNCGSYQFYNNPDIKCNFNVESVEIKGRDFEHLMLYATLKKKPMKEICKKEYVDGFGMAIDGVTGHLPIKPEKTNLEALTMTVNAKFEFPPEILFLMSRFPALFNVAGECAQLREVHSKVAHNILGEAGFIQEVENLHRKFIRLQGIIYDEKDIQVWKLRKQLFDLVNYAIAALESLDAEIRNNEVKLPTHYEVTDTVEYMVERSIQDSGGYPKGTTINPAILPLN